MARMSWFHWAMVMNQWCEVVPISVSALPSTIGVGWGMLPRVNPSNGFCRSKWSLEGVSRSVILGGTIPMVKSWWNRGSQVRGVAVASSDIVRAVVPCFCRRQMCARVCSVHGAGKGRCVAIPRITI
jgi:hypothetical protein